MVRKGETLGKHSRRDLMHKAEFNLVPLFVRANPARNAPFPHFETRKLLARITLP
jgi:hypothetical protein